jgi:hypothetical protein
LKRRTNLPSPVDSINTLVEQLQQTDSSVEDGEVVWVRSTQCLWVYRINSGLVANGADIVASLYGNGVWVRLTGQGTAAMAQLNWYIDPVNGSDSNNGQTPATALKSDAERQRRMGPTPIWDGGQALGGASLTAAAYHIFYLNDLPLTDPVNIAGFRALNAAIFLHGSATPGQGKSILFSGTIDALDTLDRTAGVNRSWQITSNALPVSWTASGLIGKRVRLTSGNVGAKSFPIKDLGAKKARMCQFLGVNTYTQPFTVSTTIAPPALTNTFVVEQLTKIPQFLWSIVDVDAGTFNTSFQPNVIESLEIGTTGDMNLVGTDTVIFDGCIVAMFETTDGGPFVTFASVRQTVLSIPGPWAQWSVFAGYCDAGTNWGLGPTQATYIFVDKDFMFQGVQGVIQAFAQLNDFASFDSPSAAVEVFGTRVQFLKTFWGQGAATFGIRFFGGAHASYAGGGVAVFNVASAGSNMSFAGRTSVEPFDPTVPAFLAARATTFANLTAAIGAGGFGGHIVDVVGDTAFVVSQ